MMRYLPEVIDKTMILYLPEGPLTRRGAATLGSQPEGRLSPPKGEVRDQGKIA